MEGRKIMKFLKSLFLKIKAKKTLKTYQKPLAITLVTLLLINILVLAVGAGIALAIDYKYYNKELFEGNFMSAFITNAKWMISPNSLTTLDVASNRMMLMLAIIIVIIGMVLFSGAIIATVTTALRTFIEKKSHAKGKIFVNNHFVILNWSSKVPEMIYNLMIKGFKHNIVILSDRNKEYIEAELKSLFLTNNVKEKIKANLIIKEGDSLLRGNLEDISIENASQICVMVKEDMVDLDDDGIVNADLLNLKIVLRLGSFKLKDDVQIVVETDTDKARGQIENLSYKIKSLRNLSITPISFNKKIGQIIAQSLIMPQMSNLYSELFSFEGSEFYSVESEQGIEEYLRTHTSAIPVYKEDEHLFLLASEEEDLDKKREAEYVTDRKFELSEVHVSAQASIFIIGDNSKTEFLLESLDRCRDYGEINFEFKHYPKDQIEQLINDVKAKEGERKILILSDDKVGADSYDANVFVTLIELSKAFPEKEGITCITELLDSRNLSSVSDFHIHNTIISNKMMSLLITQIALNKGSKRFFEKVLTIANNKKSNDFDIMISPVSRLIKIEDEGIQFETKAELLRTFYNTFDGKRILMGLVEGEEIKLLDENQDEKLPITLHKEDQFIYIKYMDSEK